MVKFGMCFSRDFVGENPLEHIGKKLPTYIHLLELCQRQGWETYVLTRKTYKSNGIFEGAWQFNDQKLVKVESPIKIDLIFDWTGTLKFPPEDEPNLKVINIRNFKELCWNKWEMYLKLCQYMPETFWVGSRDNLIDVLPKIKTGWVVLKPYNGLKGRGVYVGPKRQALDFEFEDRYPSYIAQEFVDTSSGIKGITGGLHDLRVVVVNKKVAWSHIRVPQEGTYKANVGQGGSLTEVDYKLVPSSVKEIVNKLADEFYKEYDNPIYSLDFGIDKNGNPKIFEINDQIGFPTWEMKARDNFLKALVENFEEKLVRRSASEPLGLEI